MSKTFDNLNSKTPMNKDASFTKTIEKEINLERYLIYARYFSRITKYIKRSVAVMNNFHDSFHNYSIRFEKPLKFLSLSFIGLNIATEYYKVRNESYKRKGIFFIDIFTWHALASFIFPSFIISNSIHGFVLILKRYVRNQKTLNIICIGCSIIWIPAMVTPIDTITKILMDNSLRIVLNKL